MVSTGKRGLWHDRIAMTLAAKLLLQLEWCPRQLSWAVGGHGADGVLHGSHAVSSSDESPRDMIWAIAMPALASEESPGSAILV